MTDLAAKVETVATMHPDELRAIRIKLGKSQAAMAQLIGMTQPHYALFETGRRPIHRTLALAVRHVAALR